MEVDLPPVVVVTRRVPVIKGVTGRDVVVRSLVFRYLCCFSCFLVGGYGVNVVMFSKFFDVFDSGVNGQDVLVDFCQVGLDDMFAAPIAGVEGQGFFLFVLVRGALKEIVQAVEAYGKGFRGRQTFVVVVLCRFTDRLSYPNNEVWLLERFVDAYPIFVPAGAYRVEVCSQRLCLWP